MKRALVLAALFMLLVAAFAPAAGVDAVGTTPGCPVLSLKLTPQSGPVGTRVACTGTVQVTGSTIVLTWGNDEGQELWRGKATGYEFLASFIVPKSPYGKQDVYVYTPGSGAPSISPGGDPFKVVPTVTLAPTSVLPTSAVTVSGNGFPANETVEINLDGKPLGTATIKDQGTFSADLSIPKCVSGSHVLSAVSPGLATNDSQQISFTVSPVLGVIGPPPTIGAAVTISGDGYAGNSKITLRYDDVVVVPKEKEVVTDAVGSFKATVVIPNSLKTKHTLTATDDTGSTAATASEGAAAFSLEKEPPRQPMPITPINERFGIYGSQIVAFDWSDVKDPSGITYTFEIGRDLKFFPPVLRKKDLEESQYVLEYNQALSEGTYYWRVKAIDGAGNESGWVVAPAPFSVGLIPLWGFVVAGLVGLIIALLVLRAILRFIVQLFRFY